MAEIDELLGEEVMTNTADTNSTNKDPSQPEVGKTDRKIKQEMIESGIQHTDVSRHNKIHANKDNNMVDLSNKIQDERMAQPENNLIGETRITQRIKMDSSNSSRISLNTREKKRKTSITSKKNYFQDVKDFAQNFCNTEMKVEDGLGNSNVEEDISGMENDPTDIEEEAEGNKMGTSDSNTSNATKKSFTDP